MIFQNEIVQWYIVHKRALPWRNTTDAYVIWLSEVILQQTRVEQGLPYFNKFLTHFPEVKDFAAASEEQVLKLWQGLGYYSRGRNMLFTARQVVTLHDGVFPVTYDELIRLKGIGDYTAAAIASFSSREAKAVLDGNVFRVLSRYFGISTPIDTPAGKKEFGTLATQLLADQDPAIYNQAIMEFGAMVCKPKAPACATCVVRPGCFAYAQDVIHQLPVKAKKLKKKNRWFNYFLCTSGDKILMNLRGPGDIWQGLYDLPMVEQTSPDGPVNIPFNEMSGSVNITHIKDVKHLLTHQTIYIRFFALDNYNATFNKENNWQWFERKDLQKLPMPVVIHDFLESFTENN